MSSRLGSNPLEWLSKDEKPSETEKSKQCLHSNQGLQKLQSKQSSKHGLKLGSTRATFIVKEELLKKLKDLAYWERRKIQDVVNEALEDYLKKQAQQSPSPNKSN